MSKDTITVNMNVHDIPIVIEQLEEASKEIDRLNYKINKLDEYLHKMLNATEGKYHQAIQETIWFLNMLKEYRGEDIVK